MESERLLSHNEALDALDALERRRYALRNAQAHLEFAELTDPPEATEGRGVALGEIEAYDHELLCGPEMGRVLEALQGASELSELRKAQVRVLADDRHRRLAVPASLESQRVELVNRASGIWRDAREADDWEVFSPVLEELVELYRSIAAEAAPKFAVYDFWLDHFEPESSMATYDELFGAIERTVTPLAAAIREAEGLDAIRRAQPMPGPFDPELQDELFRKVAEVEGIPLDRLQLGSTIHPFTSGVDSHHVMIANHADPEDVLSGLYAAIHEGGHALYEASVDGLYDRTCLANGTSTGIHEASSRFFENYVGRSRAFADPLRDLVASFFPENLANTSAEDFWLLANRVRFSPSRMDADELTYPLHIIIRYEVERALLSREISVAEVPGLWRRLYEEQLGVSPEGALAGPLQDVHWSMGLLGYFPAYALGGVIGAQFLAAQRAQGVPFDEALAAGDLSPIAQWMTEHVWRFGRTKGTARILVDATGEPLNPAHYCRYLEEKFSLDSPLLRKP